MVESVRSEQDLTQRLLTSLREFLDVRAKFDQVENEREHGDPDRGYDARVDLQIADQSIMLLIKVRKAVYPRDARQVLWQIRDLEIGRAHV